MIEGPRPWQGGADKEQKDPEGWGKVDICRSTAPDLDTFIDRAQRQRDRENGAFSYVPTFFYAINYPTDRPLPVVPRWVRVMCPVCSAPYRETNAVGHFCTKCGKELEYTITEGFYELAVKARLFLEYMKANGKKFNVLGVSVFCSEHRELVKQKLTSDFIDYRMITLLKTLNGRIQQSDIPSEYGKIFTDNYNGAACPATITPAQVRDSIDRLRDKGKIRLTDISTPQGKRNVVELIDSETLRLAEIASRTIKITPRIAAQLNLPMPPDSECVNS